ncbi:hypothetical protein FE76_14800, partial [Staphylococcus aureus]
MLGLGEEQHSSGGAIESMRGREVGAVELLAQPHGRGFGDVPTTRDGGEEMWLVDPQQVVVLVQDADLERPRNLMRRNT